MSDKQTIQRIKASLGCNDDTAAKYADIIEGAFSYPFMGGSVKSHIQQLDEIQELANKLKRMMSKPDVKSWLKEKGSGSKEIDGVKVDMPLNELIDDACYALNFIPEIEKSCLDKHSNKKRGFRLRHLVNSDIDRAHLSRICFEFMDYPSLDSARKDVERMIALELGQK
ncbi:hypothetical protein AB4332_04905 [Vibrio breoganii]